jgi:hypothetical protein
MVTAFLLRYVKDTFKNKTLDTVEHLPKTHRESLEELCRGEPISYYVAEINDRKQRSEHDLVVGYLAKENTSFTFNFGPISQSREIPAGTFEFAYCDQALLTIGAIYSGYSISDVRGSAYVIYATLDTPYRQAVITAPEIHLGDGLHVISWGFVSNKEQLNEQARQEANNTFCSRLSRFFSRVTAVSTNYTPVAIKAE